jgi:hypothetical protein
MHPFDPLQVTRRQFLGKASLGIGSAALASLLNPRLFAASSPSGATMPHFAPKAKRVIWLTQAGAPRNSTSSITSRGLRARFDHDLPDSVRNGQRVTGMTSGQARFPIAPSVFNFKQHGQSRPLVERVAAAYRAPGRRAVHHPFDAHRGHQPRSRR